MKLLSVMDPFSTVHPDKDSTFMMLMEAKRRGFETYYCLIEHLFVEEGRPRAQVRPVTVFRPKQPGGTFYKEGESELVYLDELDVILMRKDPPFDRAFLFSTYILDLAVGHALVVNDPVGLKLANEKMYALQFPDLIPATTVSNDPPTLRAFMERQGGRMIIKPWDMAGGAGIFMGAREDKNLNSILDMSTEVGKEWVIGQAYIPEAKIGDKRIILVGGEPVGAMLRVPASNDYRSNMHVGGSVEKTELTDRDRAICTQLAPALKRDGLLFVGIDVIGPYLTEVNVTSPTGIQEINALSGLQIERDLFDAIEGCLKSGQRRLR